MRNNSDEFVCRCARDKNIRLYTAGKRMRKSYRKEMFKELRVHDNLLEIHLLIELPKPNYLPSHLLYPTRKVLNRTHKCGLVQKVSNINICSYVGAKMTYLIHWVVLVHKASRLGGTQRSSFLQ
jgi:hypothetical protein